MAESYESPFWKADVSLNDLPSKPGPVHLDFTITNSFAETHIKQATQSPHSATIYGEKVKQQAIGKHIPSTAHFIPVALNVLGTVGNASRPFFNHLLTQLAYQSNKPFSEVATSFWIKLSVLMQRLKAQTIHTAVLALERMRKSRPTDIRSEMPIHDLIATSS